MSALLMPPINPKVYRKLLAEALPTVIRSEQQNDAYAAQLEALYERGRLTPEEEQLAELFTLLIEDFEARHYQLVAATPIEIIHELMAANGLKQADLVDVFGTRSVILEVLSGKREISKTHILRLSRRFQVSPVLFLTIPADQSPEKIPSGREQKSPQLMFKPIRKRAKKQKSPSRKAPSAARSLR